MKVIKKLLDNAVNGKSYASLILVILAYFVAVVSVTVGIFIGAWFRGG